MTPLDVVFLPFSIPHELSHYLVGRLLGVRIKLEINQVRIYGSQNVPRWKMRLIILAPTLLAVMVLIGFVVFFVLGEITRQRFRQALAGVTYAALLLTTCVGDWRDFWNDWHNGR
jgi:hypothetical protein